MTPTFHFNHRDPSFRHNLSSIGNRKGILVTKTRRTVPFDWLQVSVRDGEYFVTVGCKEDQVTLTWDVVGLVAME